MDWNREERLSDRVLTMVDEERFREQLLTFFIHHTIQAPIRAAKAVQIGSMTRACMHGNHK